MGSKYVKTNSRAIIAQVQIALQLNLRCDKVLIEFAFLGGLTDLYLRIEV
jgi:hypothetical protein